MAIAYRITRFSTDYADNLVNYFLTFNNGYTWNVSSGSGTAANSTTQVYEGDRSLKLVNNTPLVALVANSLGSETNITIDRAGDYILSFRCYVPTSAELDEIVIPTITYYVNGGSGIDLVATMSDEDGVLINDTWVTFYAKINGLSASDVLSFAFKIPAISDSKPVVTVYFDGLKLEESRDGLPSGYAPPRVLGVQQFGVYNYDNSLASYAVTASTWTKLTNDGAGAVTILGGGLSGVTPYDTSTNNFDFTDLELYDSILYRVDVLVTTTAVNQVVRLGFLISVGDLNIRLPFAERQYKSAGTYQLTAEINSPIYSESVRTNPAEMQIWSDSSATVEVNGWSLEVKKRNI